MAATTPPVAFVLSRDERIEVIASCVVVALVAVAFPTMVRLPLIVEEALEINPASVERPETPKVEEKFAAPVTASVPWRMEEPVVVAPPEMVRPVPLVPLPIVLDAVTKIPMVLEVGESVFVPETSHDLLTR